MDMNRYEDRKQAMYFERTEGGCQLTLLAVFMMYSADLTYMVRPCPKNSRRKITQNSIEVDAETKESTRKTEKKLDGRYKEGHERNKPK